MPAPTPTQKQAMHGSSHAGAARTHAWKSSTASAVEFTLSGSGGQGTGGAGVGHGGRSVATPSIIVRTSDGDGAGTGAAGAIGGEASLTNCSRNGVTNATTVASEKPQATMSKSAGPPCPPRALDTK